MDKEKVKVKLRKVESDLRQVNAALEMYKQGVKDIQEEIAKLEAIINKPDRWQDSLVQPEMERYFFLTSNVEKGLIAVSNSNSMVRRRPEHAFKTEEQAELIKEKALLMQEMYAFAHVKNEGWIPDWKADEEEKYGVACARDKAYADCSIRINHLVFGIAVKSQAIAEEMLEIFGERIEKFYNKMY